MEKIRDVKDAQILLEVKTKCCCDVCDLFSGEVFFVRCELCRRRFCWGPNRNHWNGEFHRNDCASFEKATFTWGAYPQHVMGDAEEMQRSNKIYFQWYNAYGENRSSLTESELGRIYKYHGPCGGDFQSPSIAKELLAYVVGGGFGMENALSLVKSFEIGVCIAFLVHLCQEFAGNHCISQIINGLDYSYLLEILTNSSLSDASIILEHLLDESALVCRILGDLEPVRASKIAVLLDTSDLLKLFEKIPQSCAEKILYCTQESDLPLLIDRLSIDRTIGILHNDNDGDLPKLLEQMTVVQNIEFLYGLPWTKILSLLDQISLKRLIKIFENLDENQLRLLSKQISSQRLSEILGCVYEPKLPFERILKILLLLEDTKLMEVLDYTSKTSPKVAYEMIKALDEQLSAKQASKTMEVLSLDFQVRFVKSLCVKRTAELLLNLDNPQTSLFNELSLDHIAKILDSRVKPRECHHIVKLMSPHRAIEYSGYRTSILIREQFPEKRLSLKPLEEYRKISGNVQRRRVVSFLIFPIFLLLLTFLHILAGKVH